MTFYIFIIGIVVGSFLNVCIFRIPKEQSIVFPPSSCGSCNHRLRAIDLIPLLSYIFLKGRCEYCGSKISLRYPLIELLTGLIFIFIFYTLGAQPILLKYLFLAAILIVITFIDLEYQIIPDKIVVLAMVMGIILNIYTKDVFFLSSLLGFVIGGGTLLIIALLTHGAMGGGDIKLMAVLGYYLGWESTIMAILLSFIIGGILGASLLLLQIKSRKDPIPFGPFLALGSLISGLFYNQILYYYLTTLVYTIH